MGDATHVVGGELDDLLDRRISGPRCQVALPHNQVDATVARIVAPHAAVVGGVDEGSPQVGAEVDFARIDQGDFLEAVEDDVRIGKARGDLAPRGRSTPAAPDEFVQIPSQFDVVTVEPPKPVLRKALNATSPLELIDSALKELNAAGSEPGARSPSRAMITSAPGAPISRTVLSLPPTPPGPIASCPAYATWPEALATTRDFK